MSTLCVTCGLVCYKADGKKKVYCCLCVPEEFVTKPRGEWICSMCSFRDSQAQATEHMKKIHEGWIATIAVISVAEAELLRQYPLAGITQDRLFQFAITLSLQEAIKQIAELKERVKVLEEESSPSE